MSSQVALALVLVAGAALLATSLVRGSIALDWASILKTW